MHYVPHTFRHRHSTSFTEYRSSSPGLALCSFHLGISLVSLYQTYQETQQPIPPRDKTVRMERFERWLQVLILKNNEKMETMKVESIFAQDLPKLRAAWEKIRAKANGEEK